MSDNEAARDDELREHVERALAAVYELEREIGRGGMGVVYRARDRRLKRPVAIKVLPPELAFRRDVRQRFLREAETAAQLSHPNIVPIYAVDETDNLVYFAMACVDGANLGERLRTTGPLPVDEARRILTEVADALAYAHSRGVIHRDIKPDNILLDAEDGRAMVTDFGIARAVEGGGDASRLTATGMAIGTPAYMSPEQASGERDVDGRSDLYSLGVVAYQMLTGEPPFTGNTTPALLLKHLSETPTPVEVRREDVPPILGAIVMRLLEKEPAHRFESAAALAEALRSGIVPGATFGSMPDGGRVLGNGADRVARGVPTSAPTAARAATAAGTAGMTGGAGRVGAAALPADIRGPAGLAAPAAPTADELARWEAAPVQVFRRKLAPYVFVNAVIVFFAIVSDNDFFFFTVVWTIILAYQYAKLWAEGFDWRDVLRQPRDRLLGDVLQDLGEHVQSLFDRDKREALRARQAGSRFGGALSPVPPAPIGGGTRGPAAPVDAGALGPLGAVVEAARAEREELARLVATIPQGERAKLPDVSGTAADLVRKIEELAVAVATADRALAARPLEAVDREIAELEAAANPLEAGSDDRVRRLVRLRRVRRATLETQTRREDLAGRLESCRTALENMRLDLVRLRTGGSSVQSVTEIAARAASLAREVDHAVAAAEEIRALTAGEPATAGAR